MSDTPRTNAAVHPSKLLRRPDGTFREAVDAVFARQLERELAEAQEKLNDKAVEDALAEPAIKEYLKGAEQKPMLEMNPEKREWVGLTDEEINLIYDRPHIYFTQYAKDIEGKLREKNGG